MGITKIRQSSMYVCLKTIEQFTIEEARQWRTQDLPEEGAPTPRGRQHTILPYFPKNCMKLKEFGPRGGARPSRPP